MRTQTTKVAYLWAPEFAGIFCERAHICITCIGAGICQHCIGQMLSAIEDLHKLWTNVATPALNWPQLCLTLMYVHLQCARNPIASIVQSTHKAERTNLMPQYQHLKPCSCKRGKPSGTANTRMCAPRSTSCNIQPTSSKAPPFSFLSKQYQK